MPEYLRVLGCNGGASEGCFTMSFLLKDKILLDCGTGALRLNIKQMLNISNILLTHSHLDHTAGIPMLLDAVIGNRKTIKIYANKETLAELSQSMFNDRSWPDMSKIPSGPKQNFIEFKEISPLQTFSVQGVRITALPVKHAVPTYAYALHLKDGVIIYAPDLSDFEDETIKWIERNRKKIRLIFMDCSFDNNKKFVADISGHLTTQMFFSLVSKKIPDNIAVYAVHSKPTVTNQVEREFKRQAKKQLNPNLYRFIKLDELFKI